MKLITADSSVIHIQFEDKYAKEPKFVGLQEFLAGCMASPDQAAEYCGLFALTAPKCFERNPDAFAVEHEGFIRFGRTLIETLPGLSFFIHPDGWRDYKQFMLTMLPDLRLLRRGSKTTFVYCRADWVKLVENEVNAARAFIKAARFSMEKESEVLSTIAGFLQSDKF